MKIARISLDRYRNIHHAEIEPYPQFNLIVGDNGQGKTNLLSSIYWLSTLTPLRTNLLRDLILWGESETEVQCTVEHQGLKHALGVKVKSGKRTSLREGKPCRNRDYFGALSVVCFTPNDLDLVRGGPEKRRKFLDRAIFTEFPLHLDTVLRYQKALEKRNRLLREGAGAQVLAAYEGTLAEAGARLMITRAQYSQMLAPNFSQIFHDICGFNGGLAYKPGASIGDPLSVRPEQLQAQLIQYWGQTRANDLQRGFTQRGPHVDEISIRLNDRSARKYASQGQQRAIVLALKIAQIESLTRRNHARPVLLLDDVSSELDEQRADLLFNYLKQFDGQVFLTTTHERHIPLDSSAKIWRIEAGQVLDGDMR